MGDRDANHALTGGARLGDYRILRLLASGGFSFVYLARDAKDREAMPIAIKEYFPVGLAVRPASTSTLIVPQACRAAFGRGLSCFFEEGKALARLQHANVVRVLNFFRANGTAYLVMRYEEGVTLQEHLEQAAAPPAETWLRELFASVLRGLRAVHSHGVLHLDVKPGNVYVRADGAPMLIDFGATRRALSGAAAGLSFIHTPGFASPEHHRGGELGPWSDIYSVGACMYACLLGDTPLSAEERLPEDRLPPAARRWAGKYSAALLAAIDRCLRMEPRERPQSILALQKLFAESSLVAA